METIIQTEKINAKDLLINAFSNTFHFSEFSEELSYSNLAISHKRRQLFCCNNTISVGDYMTDNPEIIHLLKRAKKLSVNSKQALDFSSIDRWFVACTLPIIVVIILIFIIPNSFFTPLFILAPLVILFLRCFRIEICTKKYNVISKCIRQLFDIKKNRGNPNSSKEYSQSNNKIITYKPILLSVNTSFDKLEDEYIEYKHQLLSLLKELYENIDIKIDPNLIKQFNNETFIFYDDLSFSIKDTTRFLAILDKRGLIKIHERGVQKEVSSFIVCKFKIRGKIVKEKTYYNSLNDTMSSSESTIYSKTSVLIIDALDALCKR